MVSTANLHPYTAATERGMRAVAVDETADCLDGMMEATLAHIDARVSKGEGAALANGLLSAVRRCRLTSG